MIRFHTKVFGYQKQDTLGEQTYRNKKNYLAKNYVYENKKRQLTLVKDNKPDVKWELLYNKEYYMKSYRERNDEIIKYFANRPNDLLIIDLTKEQDTSKIITFLGLNPQKISPMPHENKT